MPLSPQDLLNPATLARLQNYRLLAETAVEGFLSGLHRSLYHGFGTEFFQYRAWSPGEDLRHVDWKVYARRDRLYTKVYEEETNRRVHLLLDSSASLGYHGRGAPVGKLTYAAMTAAALAWMAHRQGDAVGLTIYNAEVQEAMAPSRRPGQVLRLLHALSRVEANGPADHEKAFRYLDHHLTGRGLVVLLSDFLESEETLPEKLRRLRLRHCDVLALQILDPDEIEFPRDESARFVGMEDGRDLLTSPAAIADHHDQAMAENLRQLRQACSRARLDYLPLRTDDSLGYALARYLGHRQAAA